MGIFDIFTGAPQQQAAKDQQAYVAAQQAQQNAQIAAAQKTGTNALMAGQTGALGAIQGGTTTARGDIGANTPQALDALYSGRDVGAGALTAGQSGGLAALAGGVSGALGAYDPLANLSTKYGGYADPAAYTETGALGLGGPDQTAAAVNAFHTDPGYNFSVNQGLDAITRAANIGGGVAGGNVLRESQTFGQGVADQQYQTWVKNLQDLQNRYSPLEAQTAAQVAAGRATPYLTGGTGAANIYTGTGSKLSDLYAGTGVNASGIYTGQGTSLANLAEGSGLAQGGVYTGVGSGIAGLTQGLTGQQVGAETASLAPALKTYSDAAAAQTGGSQNLWNLIGGGVQLAAGGGFIPGVNAAQAFGPFAPKKAVG